VRCPVWGEAVGGQGAEPVDEFFAAEDALVVVVLLPLLYE
jgi:hypothetical protein